MQQAPNAYIMHTLLVYLGVRNGTLYVVLKLHKTRMGLSH